MLHKKGSKVKMKKEFPAFLHIINREGALGEITESYEYEAYNYRISLDRNTYPSTKCSLSSELILTKEEFDLFFEVVSSVTSNLCKVCGGPTVKKALWSSVIDFCEKCGK